MRQIIICEKPSTYRVIKEALGDRHGVVCQLQGHAITLVEPKEIKADWAVWSPGVLWPGYLYPKRANPKGRHMEFLSFIERHIKDADRVIVATDPDREGDLIGGEIVDHFNFRGDVRRVLFLAMDTASVQKFIDAHEPFEKYRGRYDAARAREQADKIVNLSLTRTVSCLYVGQGKSGKIGVGRVRTPTLGILCRREEEISKFKPTDIYALEMDTVPAEGQGDAFKLVCDRLPASLVKKPQENDKDENDDEIDASLTPREDISDRLTDPDLCNALINAARGGKFPVKYDKSRRSSAPPKLFSLTELTTAAERELNFSPTRTLDVAQKLYDTWKMTTYPRSEYRYIPEEFIPSAGGMLDALLSIDTFEPLAEIFDGPVIRKGSKSTYRNIVEDGANHYAIIPNPNMFGKFAETYPQMSQDERVLFDVIARSWLAAHAPDYVYDHTQISVSVPHSGHEWSFKATGQVPISLGWRAIIARKGKDDEQVLPDLKTGSLVLARDIAVRKSQTRPPARYTPAALVVAMKQSWRLVEDPELIAILKEADGIGTDATRNSIVDDLGKDKQVAMRGKNIVPTDKGMTLYRLFLQKAPNIVDPGRTALWEMVYKDIENGKLTVEEGVLKIVKGANREIKALIESHDPSISLGEEKMPSVKMVDIARKISKQKEIKLPVGCLTRYDVCKTFLDEHLPKKDEQGRIPPSDKQMQYLRRLAELCSADIPEDAHLDYKVCRALIDELAERPEVKNAVRPPTEKQVELLIKIASELSEDVPEEALKSMDACSKYIEEKGKLVVRKPSEKQIELAHKLALEKNEDIPAEVLENSKLCSEFIQARMGSKEGTSGGTNPPSEKQLAFARKLSEETGKKIPKAAETDWRECKKFIDLAIKANKKSNA